MSLITETYLEGLDAYNLPPEELRLPGGRGRTCPTKDGGHSMLRLLEAQASPVRASLIVVVAAAVPSLLLVVLCY